MSTDENAKRARSSNSFISVINSWLERMGVVQTFEGNELELEQDIIAIRELLGSEDEKEPSL